MFSNSGVESVDLSNFNTEKVEKMGSLFEKCENLTKVNLSNFKVKSETEMEKMFAFCPKLEKKNIITKDQKILAQYDKDKLVKEEEN